MTDLDPAAVMAEHAPNVNLWRGHQWCLKCGWESRGGDFTHWPCEPYRLAEALVAAQEDVARLSAYSAAAFDQRDAAQDALAASEAKVALLCLEPSPFLDEAVCVRAAGHEDEHVSSAHVEDRAATEGFSYVVTAPEQAS